MKANIQSAVATAATILAVCALLQVQAATARGQAETADRIVAAMYRYEEAAKHGTPTEKRIAYRLLMNVLQRSEGQ